MNHKIKLPFSFFSQRIPLRVRTFRVLCHLLLINNYFQSKKILAEKHAFWLALTRLISIHTFLNNSTPFFFEGVLLWRLLDLATHVAENFMRSNVNKQEIIKRKSSHDYYTYNGSCGGPRCCGASRLWRSTVRDQKFDLASVSDTWLPAFSNSSWIDDARLEHTMAAKAIRQKLMHKILFMLIEARWAQNWCFISIDSRIYTWKN